MINNYFSYLDGALQNCVGVLNNKNYCYDAERQKGVYYVDLRTDNEVKVFLDFIQGAVQECCEYVGVLSKVLYYCERNEIEETELSQYITLMGVLGRFGEYLLKESEGMTEANTKPKKDRI